MKFDIKTILTNIFKAVLTAAVFIFLVYLSYLPFKRAAAERKEFIGKLIVKLKSEQLSNEMKRARL